MDNIVIILPYMMMVFIVLESLRIIRDSIRLKSIGDVLHVKYEWMQFYQVPLTLFTLYMSFQITGYKLSFELPVYIGILLITIIRICMGQKIAEEGMIVSNQVLMYDDVLYWSYDTIAEKEVKVKVPYNINQNFSRTFKFKIDDRSKSILLKQFHTHGVEEKSDDHKRKQSNL